MESNRSPGIDLHIHSTASDGTLSPSEILKRARQQGLAAISITDHDTMAGCREAIAAGLPDLPAFVTGVEISAAPPSFYPVPGSIHMLGYGISPDDDRLNGILETLQDSRRNRNPGIISRLNDLGFDITMDEVIAESGAPDQLGRPHIARTMVKKGIAPDFNAAFDRYIGNHRPAYVDKYRVPFHEAVNTVHQAGGVAVIAHPGLYDAGSDMMPASAMAAFAAAGIDGVEVYYPEHTPRQTDHYKALAARHGLLITGGTDFHGGMKPEITLGAGYGDLHIPEDLFRRLMAALAR